jgi:hypothetical protein
LIPAATPPKGGIGFLLVVVRRRKPLSVVVRRRNSAKGKHRVEKFEELYVHHE